MCITVIFKILRAIRIHSNATFKSDGIVVLIVRLTGKQHIFTVQRVHAVTTTRW